jgi:large subunit ribosomal protein L24
MAMRIRKDDDVLVIAGKDRGKRGKVLRADPKHERVYVEGLNMVKRHTRPRALPGGGSDQQSGGVIEREGPIHVSNVMLVDPKDGRRTRVRIQRDAGGRNRITARSGTKLD